MGMVRSGNNLCFFSFQSSLSRTQISTKVHRVRCAICDKSDEKFPRGHEAKCLHSIEIQMNLRRVWSVDLLSWRMNSTMKESRRIGSESRAGGSSASIDRAGQTLSRPLTTSRSWRNVTWRFNYCRSMFARFRLVVSCSWGLGMAKLMFCNAASWIGNGICAKTIIMAYANEWEKTNL